MKYIVRMSQESYFDMEVEADDEVKAMARAEQHAIDGERVARDDDREWDTITAIEATPKED